MNGWTSTYPLSASETAGFTVPEGQPGDLLSIVAGWPYQGVTAGTEYEYEWYRNGQLLETNRNMLFHDVGHKPSISTRLIPGPSSRSSRGITSTG